MEKLKIGAELFVRANSAGVAPWTSAVSLYVPEIMFACIAGAVATPALFATTLVSWRVPKKLDGPDNGEEKRTIAAGTGFPDESTTCAASGVENIAPTNALSGVVPGWGRSIAAAPFTTVSVSDRMPERDPLLARICARPTRCPVKTALFLSPAATRSVSAIPPASLTSNQSDAMFPTKLSDASRAIEYMVIDRPDSSDWVGIT